VLLTKAGFNAKADGVFGKGTARKVVAFQKANDLVADGIVGKKTWDILRGTKPAPKIELPIDFRRVADLFPQMYPQQYRLSDAQCPSNPPGMSLKNIGDKWTNCVQFTAWLLVYAFEATFTKDQWQLWMVSKLDSRVPVVPNWGPRVVLEWGVATTAPGEGAYLLQYFTETGGHSLIVLARDPATDKILTLESVGGINGAGWGQIGPLRDVPNPGPNWMDKVTQTWKGRIESKVGVHMARLAIDPRTIKSWVAEGPSS